MLPVVAITPRVRRRTRKR